MSSTQVGLNHTRRSNLQSGGKLNQAFKPIFVSATHESELIGEQMYRDTIKKQKEIASKGDLNNWENCNPQHKQDVLPQPYRFVDKVLNEMIFAPVFRKIFEIEKTYKSDPNYEGNISEFPPQGFFEINGMTAVHSDPKNRLNCLTAGDSSGNLFVLDLNKKTQICKKEVVASRRITHISSETTEYGNTQLMTIAVVLRADSSVYIYRFLSGDNKLYHHFTVKVLSSLGESASNKVQDSTKYANSFPHKVNISLNADFLSVTTFNGDVHVYSIPEPPQQPIQNDSLDEQQNSSFSSPGIIGSSQKRSTYSGPSSSRLAAIIGVLDIKATDIDKPYYSVYFTGVKVQASVADLVEKINTDTFNSLNPELIQQQLLEQQAALKDKKEVKKDTKKGGKDEPLLVVEEIKTQPEKKEILFNQILALPESVVSASGQDISSDIPAPQFEPLPKFLKTAVSLPDPNKLFSKKISFQIVSDLLVAWKEHKSFEIHHLRPPKKEFLPSAIYDSLKKEVKGQSGSDTHSTTLSNDKSSTKNKQINGIQSTQPPQPIPPTQAQLRTQLPSPKPSLTKKYSLIYPITYLNINESESFAGFGLKDGTVILWDLHYQIQKMALDRHVEEVTCLDFLENWRLISGSKDGSIHLYDLEKGKMMMKRTNVFMQNKNYEIKGISVSDSGLAFVLDSLKNLRVYDLWHGQKIAKLSASTLLDTKSKSWTLFPNCLLSARRDQLCILADTQPQLSPEDEDMISRSGEMEREELKHKLLNEKVKTHEKDTSIAIFRVYDLLVNTFPGLANVSHRGIVREKLINLFGRLSLANLNDPKFEVPLIGPPQTLAGSVSPRKDSLADQSRTNHRKSISKFFLPSILKNKSVEESFTNAGNYNTSRKSTANDIQHQENQGRQSSRHSFDSGTDLNSSFRTQLTHTTHIKTIPLPSGRAKLTKEILHPERFLLEKIKMPGQQLKNTETETIDFCRKRFDEKDQRDTNMATLLVKIQQELEKQEEKKIKQIPNKVGLGKTTKPETFRKAVISQASKTSYK